MTSNKQEAYDIKYKDGKPVKVKIDPIAELQKELQEPEEQNLFDVEKRALYANTPSAEVKKDRSLTARALNAQLESFNKKRDNVLNKNN